MIRQVLRDTFNLVPLKDDEEDIVDFEFPSLSKVMLYFPSFYDKITFLTSPRKVAQSPPSTKPAILLDPAASGRYKELLTRNRFPIRSCEVPVVKYHTLDQAVESSQR
jgi:hypothetical protein